MINLNDMAISVEDDILPGSPFKRGKLTINGASGNAQATVWAWDEELKRYRQVDRLTEVTWKEGAGGTIQLTGLSNYLLEEIGVPNLASEEDGKLTITVRPAKVTA